MDWFKSGHQKTAVPEQRKSLSKHDRVVFLNQYPSELFTACNETFPWQLAMAYFAIILSVKEFLCSEQTFFFCTFAIFGSLFINVNSALSLVNIK